MSLSDGSPQPVETVFVRCFTGDALKVISQARIGRMRLQQLDQLVARHPPGLIGYSMRNQIGDRLAAHGDHHALARLDPAQQVSGLVSQLACGNFYDSATSVASRFSPAGR